MGNIEVNCLYRDACSADSFLQDNTGRSARDFLLGPRSDDRPRGCDPVKQIESSAITERNREAGVDDERSPIHSSAAAPTRGRSSPISCSSPRAAISRLNAKTSRSSRSAARPVVMRPRRHASAVSGRSRVPI